MVAVVMVVVVKKYCTVVDESTLVGGFRVDRRTCAGSGGRLTRSARPRRAGKAPGQIHVQSFRAVPIPVICIQRGLAQHG